MRQIEKRVGFKLSRLLHRRHLRRRRFSWEYPSAVGKNLSELYAPRVTRRKTELQTRKSAKGCVILRCLSRAICA